LLGWFHLNTAANGGRDAADVRELLQPVMPALGESHTATADVVQSVLDAVTELMAGEIGERLLLGSAKLARDDRRQARELAGLICKSEEAIDRFISFCEQQAHDLLFPHAPLIMSLQIILRMRREMTGRELDQALATVLGQFDLAVERGRQADWRKRELAASRFRAECG